MYPNSGNPQYPSQGSRPINHGYNQSQQEYAVPQSLYVERRSTNPLPTPVNRAQPTSSYNQNYAIPQSFYVERRSTNPVPTTQPNQPQYIESNQPKIGYQNARAVQEQTSGMYHHKNPGTPNRNVNPALVANPSPYSTAQFATNGRESLFAKKETRGEIDDAPIIDPSAFRYLNLNEKKPSGRPSDESGIDSRPIINLDAVTQLEKRRQQQIEKNNRLRGDDGSGSGIDGRSLVNVNAFRHIEEKNKKNKGKEQQDSGIDSRPITNPDAFKYLEARREAKPSPNNANESIIDTRPIINPDAFKYLEKRQESLSRDNEGSGIDYKPIVNPDAFKYLEKPSSTPRRNSGSGIDTRSIVDPSAFQNIERKGQPKQETTESSIDYRPIVNPAAFKYIEAKPKPRVIDGPDIDERSYVSPHALQHLNQRRPEQRPDLKSEIDTRSFILDRNPHALAHLEGYTSDQKTASEQSGIDQRSYVNPNSFRYLEGLGDTVSQSSVHSSTGPIIDTKSYVNPESFRHLEDRQRSGQTDANDQQGIDERSFVSPAAFRHLEFDGGQSDL